MSGQLRGSSILQVLKMLQSEGDEKHHQVLPPPLQDPLLLCNIAEVLPTLSFCSICPKFWHLLQKLLSLVCRSAPLLTPWFVTVS